MAIEISEETSAAGQLNAQTVADAFLHQYYLILHKSPKILYRFYKDQSVLYWPGVGSATTMQGIHDKIMSSDYEGCLVEVVHADAQESLMEGVILTVTGCLIGKDNVRKIFSQTFFLAKQEKGYFVLNDNFRMIDTKEILNLSLACDAEENASIASSSHEPELTDVPAQPKPVKVRKSMEATDNGETVPEVAVPEVTVTEVTVPEVTVTEVTVTAAEVPKPPVTPTENVCPLTASNVKHDGQKTSYASVVAKESKVASPTDNSGHKVVRVAPTANQQSIASSAPIIGGVTKELISSSHGSTENNSDVHSNTNINFHAEASIAKTVYIQNLPSDITKNELADAVKKFGRVRPAGIQLKTFEDGFCFGFVEFESATAAKNAVEARSITVKGYDSRISFKKSGARAGSGTRSSGGYRGGNMKGQDGEIRAGGGYRDDNRGDYLRGSDQQNREFNRKNNRSRDGRAHGGEAYQRNNWRNEERWGNGGGQQRNGQQMLMNDRGRSADSYQRGGNNEREREREQQPTKVEVDQQHT